MALFSKTDFVNLALANVRHQSRITNFDTDSTILADRARQFYPQAIQLALADYDFTWASKTIYLQEIADAVVPEPYTYALRIPQDYIRQAKEGIQDTVMYMLGGDDSGPLMYSSQKDFNFKYIRDISDLPFIMPVSFRMGASYFLSALMAPELTGIKGRDAVAVTDALYQKADAWLTQEKVLDGNAQGYRRNEDEWPTS